MTGNIGFLLAFVEAQSDDHYRRALSAEGLEAHHVGVLELLARDGAMKQARIAEGLSVFKPVVVTLINDLEARGLVKRRPHPTDRRAVAVHLLAAGQEKLNAVRAIGTAASDQFFGVLGTAEREAFRRSLVKLAKASGG